MSVPDSVLFGHCVHWGVGAGIWEHTKGLLNHHIAAAATERETFHRFPLSFFLSFLMIISTAAYYLWRGSVV